MNSEWLPYIPSDDIYLFNTGHATKAWLSFGCRYIPELRLHRFLVWAPNARSVTVVGDFNDWHWDDTPMERVPGGCWVAFVPGVWHGAHYKICVEGCDGAYPEEISISETHKVSCYRYYGKEERQ